MATQRVTVAKLGGRAADVILLRLKEWASARQTSDPTEWSSEQWPSIVRRRADALADRLRTHALSLPVVYFSEWADLWSMGDLFLRVLTPPDAPCPLIIHADRLDVYGYGLPDGGRLNQHLARTGPQQFAESDWLLWQSREAIRAGQGLVVDRAALVVASEVVGGLVTDEELSDSLSIVPEWLSEI